MLTVYYNDKFDDKENEEDELKLKVAIDGVSITCYFPYKGNQSEKDENIVNFDTLNKLDSYTSYALVKRKNKNISVKHAAEVYTSTCQWVNLNRLGVAVKEDFGRLLFLYDYSIIAQLDTGLIAEDNTDMVLNVVACSLQSIEIETDMEYKTKPKSELAGKYPRRNLWDNYSLSINHQEYKADNWGNMLQGNSICPLVCEESKEYIDFTITKYKGFFTGEKLLRDIDNEEVFIESSAGLCIPTRVRLKNGVGTFRIYPFGYKGFVKVKLGHKWYKVWNDYSFNFG